MQDVEARQRNIVFPDTAYNEARFWRNIIHGKQRLTALQMVGICVFGAAVLALAFLITFSWSDPSSPGLSWRNLVAGSIDWLIGFGVLGIFLWFFHLSQRRNRR